MDGYTYIFDNLGGSFKDYVLAHNAAAAIDRLKRGLDLKSCDYVDYCIKSAMQFPDLSLRELFGENKALSEHYYPQWLVDDVRDLIARNPPVAGYGLNALPEKALDYIKSKVFFDLGAFDGWSAYEMEKFSPKKIYSFDISPKNHEMYKETAKIFRLPNEFNLLALGDCHGEMFF